MYFKTDIISLLRLFRTIFSFFNNKDKPANIVKCNATIVKWNATVAREDDLTSIDFDESIKINDNSLTHGTMALAALRMNRSRRDDTWKYLL